MRSLVAAELLKVRTTRSPYVATALSVVLAAVLPVLYAVAAQQGTVDPIRSADLTEMLRGPARFAGGAVLLIGLLAAAGEFGHRTVLTTRLAEPHPERVLAAKLAALGLVGGALGVVVELVALGAGVLVMTREGVPVQPFAHGAVQVAFTVPALLALHGVLGVAVGALLRSTAAVVGVVLFWAFVVEGVVPVVARRPGLADWLPSGLVDSMLRTEVDGRLAPAAAAVLLLTYAAGLVAVTTVLDRRREA